MPRDFFDFVTSHHANPHAVFFNEAVLEAAIIKACLHPGMTVAHIGAGVGLLEDELAPLVEKVHLLCATPAELQAAGQNLARFTNLEFHVVEGPTLPLPDASQDTVFGSMHLHHVPSPLEAIREMARILRPGGRLVIADLDAHECGEFQSEMADLWPGFERRQLCDWFEQVDLVNRIIEIPGEPCWVDLKGDTGKPARISSFVAVGTKRIAARQSVQASSTVQALGGTSCCGDSSCCAADASALDSTGSVNWEGGYAPSDKADVPSEAAEFSLGCGNPLAMASLREGETVLDIGSGGGLDAFIAARRVGPSGQVIGVDMTPAMLQRARRAAVKGGFGNVKFKHGYAEALPVADACVDVIISNCVINLAEDKGKVFREAYRVLRMGGRLEVNDMVFGGAILPSVHTDACGWAGCISGALPELEYVDLVKQAGFKGLTVRRGTSAGSFAGVPVYSIQVSAKK